jgi:SAM-dependent methyltransferase
MMTEELKNLITGDDLALSLFIDAQRRPDPFEPGAPRFWDDPHISEQMLAVHLDAQSDAASRRPHIIDREVAWMVIALELQEGQRVLDLGCGPGHYARRLAAHGLAVTGMDINHRALAYARESAVQQELDIAYVNQDYLTLDIVDHFDAILMVNGDFCALAPEERDRLLNNIRRALKPGGYVALDVLTRAHSELYGTTNRWYAAESGFWRPTPHLVLEEGFAYPREHVYLNQYTIVDADGTVTVYRNWFQHYTPESIAAELTAHDLTVSYLGANLRGGAYTDDAPWIGLIARSDRGET